MADSSSDQYDYSDNKGKLVANQHYDESLSVNDDEEVPSPRPGMSTRPRNAGAKRGVRGDSPPKSPDPSSDEFSIDEPSGIQPQPPQINHPPQSLEHSFANTTNKNNGNNDNNKKHSATSRSAQSHSASKMQQHKSGGYEIDEDDDDQSVSSDDEKDQSNDAGHHEGQEGAYDPAEFAHLPVNSEIKDLFQYITRYTPHTIELDTKLRPFIPDYIPAVGDIDAFVKVPRPDNKADTLGMTVLDEPCANQSDPTVLDLQLRTISKQSSAKSVSIRSIEHADKNSKAIDAWIQSIGELHRQKPPPNVHYTRNMPDVESLMQEWPAEFEELLNKVGLPTAELDCDLNQYVDIVLGLLDIPTYNSKIESLHVLFTLYSEFKNSQHFRNLAKNESEVWNANPTENTDQPNQDLS